MDEAKCGHELCRCRGDEVKDDGYCSDSCRERREESGGCVCGHAACG